MGKRLERVGEVRIIDETNGFGLDFVEKTESRFWSRGKNDIQLLVGTQIARSYTTWIWMNNP